MNQLYRQGIIILATLLVLIGLGALTSQWAQKYPISASTQSKVTKTVIYQGEDNKTALELLQKSHQVEVTESSIGTFVKSIDGISQTENAYWLYYIDGQPGEVAADKAVTKNGQTVEWRYESF
jgi:hypothetical protein